MTRKNNLTLTDAFVVVGIGSSFYTFNSQMQKACDTSTKPRKIAVTIHAALGTMVFAKTAIPMALDFKEHMIKVSEERLNDATEE